MSDDRTARPHVVIVGGGIAGLAAAVALRESAGDAVRVTVLEGSPSVGGKLALTEVAGVVCDAGAESLLVRRPEALALLGAAGLSDQVVHPAARGASLWTRGRLRPIPAGQLMGIPGDLRALAASGTVSLPGLLRIPLDHVLPATAVEDDVSVGTYVGARLGREVVERLVEPFLGGVYAGHADEISLDAALPQLSTLARSGGSLLTGVAGLLARAAPGPGREPVFASVEGGLGRLPGALARASGAEIRTRSMVRELRRTPEGWRLVVGPAREPEVVTADAVVLAVPAAAASRLLQPLAPDAAAVLAEIEYASVALVTYALPREQVTGRLPGTGFLVPPVEGRTIKAATYASSKWAWLDAASDDVVVVRTSVGRHREEADLQRDDADLAGVALADLCDAVGARLRPVDQVVTRWGGGLPQYAVGHLDRVARVRRSVAAMGGLAVCGAAYDGVGVPACAASATVAVDQVLRGFADRPEWAHG